MEKKILKFSDVSHLSLYHLLSDTEYNDELKFLFDEIVEGHMTAEIKNPLLILTSDYDFNCAEKQFFEKLNLKERNVFEYSRAFQYAHMMIQSPLIEYFDENSLVILNSYFKNIKFIK